MTLYQVHTVISLQSYSRRFITAIITIVSIFIVPNSGLTDAQFEHLHNFHEDLEASEINEVFGVEKREHIPEYALFAPHSSLKIHKTHPEFTHATLNTGHEKYELNLRPRLKEMLSPGLISYVRDKTRSIRTDGALPVESDCHFVGQVLNHKNATVAISNCNHLRGTIIMEDHFLLFHPLPTRFDHTRNKRSLPVEEQGAHAPHVIYKRSAGLKPIPEEEIQLNYAYMQPEFKDFCDVSLSIVPEYNNYTAPTKAHINSYHIFESLDALTLEIALFLDSKLWLHFNKEFGPDRAEKELTDFALAVINNVHVLYQQSSLKPNINMIIVRFEIWKEQPDELKSELHKNGQAQLLLDAFCNYQSRINPGTDDSDPAHWDHAVTLTGYDLYHTTSSVAGVAPVARMCDHLYTCALVEGLHLGRSFVLAHEMGHNLGMVHDGVQNLCSRSCCLMSAINGAGKTTWSPCSVRELNAYIESLGTPGSPPNCLDDSGIGHPTWNHDKDKRMPGQRFTGDQQCSFFWGRDYKQEIPSGRTQAGICHILWCGNGGSTISTAHPALPGTWCGGRRWCSEGQCKPWPINAEPNIVDGEWSSWMQLPDSKCSDCSITGGIRIRREHRNCDDPAPNNGGAKCGGAAIRGIVCEPDGRGCGGFSRLTYGNRLCRSFRNDRSNPDTQLDGRTFLHPSHPCKVWCHLVASDLIRNKAQYPDGTPCGFNKHCVSGDCMALSCRNSKKAVVDNPLDCPGNETILPAPSQIVQAKPIWGQWTDWSHCSVTCGSGIERRTRECNLKQSGCNGESQQTRSCRLSACTEWLDWGPWSTCSASCDNGYKIRNRSCNIGLGCQGAASQEEECTERSCSRWSEWNGWTPCDVTCGDGLKTRDRVCVGGDECLGNNDEINACNLQPCPTWSEWSSWSICSASCGPGDQSRKRVCLNGPGCLGTDQENLSCLQEECPTWSSWGNWEQCSTTCGTGVRFRQRPCNSKSGQCNGPNSEAEACSQQACSRWSTWSAWGSCSVSCGGGSRDRSRACHGADRFNCRGPSQHTQKCALQSCPVERISWSDWSSCSVSCGGGSQTREKVCSLSSPSCRGSVGETRSCNTQNCSVWRSWTSWDLCSATCGRGSQSRTRTCEGGSSTLLIVDTGPRKLSEKVETCNGEDKDSRECSEGNCPSSQGGSESLWQPWQPWSPCSVSCGLGFQTRRRDCQFPSLCDGVSQQTLTCRQEICASQIENSIATLPQWSSWSIWSSCSASCGGGVMSRTRFCRTDSARKQCGGPAGSLDVEECNPEKCEFPGEWSRWSSWSLCSVTCGQGTKGRSRACLSPSHKDCIGDSSENIPCKLLATCRNHNDLLNFGAVNRISTRDVFSVAAGEGLPRWSNWTQWSGCSCFSLRRVRRRYCQVLDPQVMGFCLGPLLEEDDCQPIDCAPVTGEWGKWSSWSLCSKDCGHDSSRIRHRVCADPFPVNRGSYCRGKSFEKEPCNVSTTCSGIAINGDWTVWSKWSECSAQCKRGYRSRTRFCASPRPANGGVVCSGGDFDLEKCNDCPSGSVSGGWGTWSSWSDCDQSCGFSFQKRNRYCDNPQPSKGGSPCRGLAYLNKICTLPPCSNESVGARSNITSNTTQPSTPSPSILSSSGQTVVKLTRRCSFPAARNGGFPCQGISTDLRSCTALNYNHCSLSISNNEKLDHLARTWERYQD